jgi:hypothetical protein
MDTINKDVISLYIKGLKAKGYSDEKIAAKLQNVGVFMEWAYEKDLLQYKDYQHIKDEIAKYSSLYSPTTNFTASTEDDEPDSSDQAGSIQGRAPPQEASKDLAPSGLNQTDNTVGDFFALPHDQSRDHRQWIHRIFRRIPLLGLNSVKSDFGSVPSAYIGAAFTLVLMAILGAGMYSNFFKESSSTLAFPSTLTSPSTRILSFQGRLTDSLGNPITASTNMRFRLYTASSGGTTLYDSGTCAITPDPDGIHNVLIGSDCGAGIGSGVFTENAAVWLGVTVGSDAEMTPRQQIANVAYALNAETLQGFPAGTTASTIPFISQGGELLIAATTPRINSAYVSETFALSSANSITIQAAGSGDVTLTATESGKINFLTGGASAGVIANGGNWGIGSANPSTFKLQVNGDVGPETDSAHDLGSNSVRWANVYADNLIGTISPGFTEGSVVFANSSGNLAQDNTNFFWNDTTNKLGIGSASPDGKLHVTGAAIGKALAIFNETGDQNVLAASASGVTIATLSRTGNLAIEGALSDLSGTTLAIDDNLDVSGSLFAGTGDAFQVDASGNVIAVGTTLSGDLAVNGGDITSTGALTITAAGGNLNFQPNNDTDDYIYFNTTGNESYIYWEGQSSNDPGISVQSGLLAYRDNNDAGWTTFASLAGGSSPWTDAGDYLHPTAGEYLGNNSSAGSNKIVGLYLADSAPVVFGTDNDITYAFSGSTLAVTLGNNDVNFDSNTLFIDGSADKVGIGTATPDGKFHTSGAAIGKALAIFNETGNQDIIAASASGNTRFRVANDGSVFGGYFVDISNTAYGLDPAGTTNFGGYSLKVTGGALLAADSGNVGIGNQTPVGKLDVNGAVIGKALTIFNETGDQNILTASASGTTVANLDRSGNLSIEGSISDLSGTTLTINDNADITGTTGLTLSGNGAGINFSGTGTHAISASSGTLQLGAVTLGGAVAGNSQTVSGLGTLSFGTGNVSITGTTVGLTTDTDLLSLAANALTVNGTGTFTSTLSVQGNTIGLNNDAHANNLLGIAAAGGAAGQDLFWGSQLVCDAGETNCGWLTSTGAVTSITGTANQISASASTGAVTLSIPSDFRAPGTVNAVSGLYTGAGAGTQRIDASGNLVNIGNITASGTVSASDFTCTDCLDFTEFADTLTLDAALTLNQSTNTWTQNFAGTTTTGLTYNANSLTTGTALAINSTSTALTSGSLLTLDWSPGSSTTNDDDLFRISASSNGDVSGFYINLLKNAASIFSVAQTGNIITSGDLEVNGGDITTSATTFNLINTTATTLNIGGAATTLELGATTGTTSVNNALTIDGDTTLGNASGDSVTSNASTWTFANDTNFVLSGGVNGLSLDGTTFSVDATNDRIGIGTAAPDGKLHVTGANIGKALVIFNETGDQNVFVASVGGTLAMAVTNAGDVSRGDTHGVVGLNDQASLAPNSSFEIYSNPGQTLPDGWFVKAGTVAKETTNVKHGSLALSLSTNTTTAMSSCFPISAGRTYAISAWHRNISGPGAIFRAGLYTYTSKSNCVGDTGTISDDNGQNNITVSSTYATTGSTNANTTAGTFWARAYVRNQSSTDQVVLVDGLLVWPATNTSGLDLAETYPVESVGAIEPGHIVRFGETPSGYDVPFVKKSREAYDKSIFGIAATAPGLLLDDGGDYPKVQVALAGRVPVQVTTENGDIEIGDAITASSLPGIGMKATKPSYVVGRAMTSFSSDDPSDIGVVTVFVEPGFNGSHMFAQFEEMLADATGIIQSDAASMGSIIVESVTSATVSAQEIVSASISATQAVIDTLIVDKIVSRTIKTEYINTTGLTADHIKAESIESKSIESNSIKSDAILTTDLTANNISGKDASFSGTLTADSIDSASIRELRERLEKVALEQSGVGIDSDLLASSVEEIQAYIYDLENDPTLIGNNAFQRIEDQISMDSGTVESINGNSIPLVTAEKLFVTQQASATSLAVTDTFMAGDILIQQDKVLSLNHELRLSALETVNILDGAVVISRDGTITAKGEVIAQKGVRTNSLKSIDDHSDITVELGTNNNNALLIQSAESGKDVASIDSSGSAKFADLSLEKFTDGSSLATIIAAPDNYQENGIFAPAIKTNAATTGNAMIPAYNDELVIYNEKVTKDSLIYITATSQTKNKLLYVAEKVGCENEQICIPYFRVALDGSINNDVGFNWWIVN